MLTVWGIWFYIFATSLTCGFAAMTCLKRLYGALDYNISMQSSLLCGLVILSVYAEIFSIFHGVGLIANIILVALSCISLICSRSIIFIIVKNAIKKVSIMEWVLIGFTFIALSIVCAGEPLQVDGYGYGAQTVHWIEQYGCVPGIANIISRLGFNSSSHCLNALFSFSFLGKQSFHCAYAWFSLYLAIMAIHRLMHFLSHKYHFADAMCICALVSTLIDTAWQSSPVTDIPTTVTVQMIIILWLILLERQDKEEFEYILLCFIGIFAVTLKFSAAMIVLLCIWPLILIVKKHRYKSLILSVLIGVFILLPFLIRNVIISGWLIYPVPLINIFNFDWKVPISNLYGEISSILITARYRADYVSNDHFWLYHNVVNDSLSHNILKFELLIMVILETGYFVLQIKRRSIAIDWVIYKLVMYAGLIFWFISAPHVRFGWAYIFAFITLFPVEFYGICNKKKLRKLPAVATGLVLLMFTAFYTYRTARIIISVVPKYLIVQGDYDPDYANKHGSSGEQKIDYYGYVFYVGPNPGYSHFPAFTNSDPNKIEMRGNRIEDGFRTKQQ